MDGARGSTMLQPEGMLATAEWYANVQTEVVSGE